MSWGNIAEILVSSGVEIISGSLGVGLAFFAKSRWLSYKSFSSKFDTIERLPEVPISGLRSIISESSPFPIAKDFVIIRGRVKSVPGLKPNCFISSNAIGERYAVLIRIFRKLQYGEKDSQSTLRKVPFLLAARPSIKKDSASDYVRVNLDNSTHELPLSTVYEFGYSTTNEQVSSNSNLYSEEILPTGTEITAVGRVCRLEDGSLQIQSCKELPYFLSKMTKVEMLDALTGEKASKLWRAVLLASLSLGVLVYVYRRISRRWKHWKKYERALQQIRDRAAASENKNSTKEDEGDNEEVTGMPLCVVCMSRKRAFVFLPCGHLLCCARCTRILRS